MPPERAAIKPGFAEERRAAAVKRARRLGVGADEVLVAAGQLTSDAATAGLAASLGLRVAGPDTLPAPQGAQARAALRTGILMEDLGERGGRFTLAIQGRDAWRLQRAVKADPRLKERMRLLSPAALRRHLMVHAGESLCEGAAFDLLKAAPGCSAATLRPLAFLARAGLILGGPLALGLVLAPASLVLALQAILSLVFLAWITLRLAGCLYPPPRDAPGLNDDRALPVYSLFVPLYREAASVPRLAKVLQELDYPGLGSNGTKGHNYPHTGNKQGAI